MSAGGARESRPAGTNPAGRWEILAWAMYDFANSGYATVVLTTIYGAYFVGVVGAGLDVASPGSATLVWTLAIGLANLVVLVSGPVMGAIADYHASKKRFLLAATGFCVAATAALALAGPGQVAMAVPLLVVSAIAYSTGENFIAAFLPEIAHGDRLGRVSGHGWALGYFGGLLTLGLCLAYINRATGRGDGPESYVPVALLITATVFALAATPTLVWLRERAVRRPRPPGDSWIRAGFDRVRLTLGHARQLPDLFRFLLCLTLYQSGVATVVVIAAIYSQEVMGFSSTQLIVLVMVVNLTAAAGAYAFGHAQDYWGSEKSLGVALLVWVVAVATAYFADSQGDMWLAGNLIGLAMGSTQAGGRALIAHFTPVARNAEFFGLWGLAAKAAAIIGPVSYGLLGRLAGGNHRLALLSTLGFFIAGLLLLITVDEERGRRAKAALGDLGE